MGCKKIFTAIVEFETKVATFYQEISDDVKQGFGTFFDNMAQDEYRHAKIYSALSEKAVAENIQLNNTEEAEYLDTLMTSSLFDEKGEFMEKAKKITSKFQVLDIAERVEREALQYIYELTRLFPDFAKDEVAVLLKEEKKHLQMVLDRKKEAQSAFLGL